MKRLKIILGVVLGMSVLLPGRACGTDIPISPTGAIFKFQTNPTWGISGPGGFNNNFFFTPFFTAESVCVYVKNNNTTNSHTFTASIVVNGDPANTTPSDATWQAAATSANLSANTSPGFPAGIGAYVSGVAQVSINFSASSVQAGSPETATVTLIQTTGNCFSGNQFIGSATQTISAVPAIQAISEGLSQSFTSGANVLVNPVVGITLSAINANNGAKTLYPDKVVITSTVSTNNIQIDLTNTVGNCPGVSTSNLKAGSAVASTASDSASVNGGTVCPTPPNISTVILTNIGVTTASPTIIDLRGIIIPSGTLTGIDVRTVTGAIAGNVSATFFWYEK